MYVAPSFELVLFAVEDIMTESAAAEEETTFEMPENMTCIG